mmetsp:Transcript_16115/g.52496  ORF Transcript_16115/g.52496 Transcript_16115/m.52496 type:complete len:356 (-) Transcript_16115:58-1125(-)|eukprot:scaffold214_cov121-Isochrysis_galbana.AAC.3
MARAAAVARGSCVHGEFVARGQRENVEDGLASGAAHGVGVRQQVRRLEQQRADRGGQRMRGEDARHVSNEGGQHHWRWLANRARDTAAAPTVLAQGRSIAPSAARRRLARGPAAVTRGVSACGSERGAPGNRLHQDAVVEVGGKAHASIQELGRHLRGCRAELAVGKRQGGGHVHQRKQSFVRLQLCHRQRRLQQRRREKRDTAAGLHQCPGAAQHEERIARDADESSAMLLAQLVHGHTQELAEPGVEPCRHGARLLNFGTGSMQQHRGDPRVGIRDNIARGALQYSYIAAIWVIHAKHTNHRSPMAMGGDTDRCAVFDGLTSTSLVIDEALRCIGNGLNRWVGTVLAVSRENE